MKEPMSDKNPTWEPHDIKMDDKIERCPYMISKRYGDEGVDYCSLSEKPSGRISACILMSEEVCDMMKDPYEEYLNAGVLPGNLEGVSDET